MVYGGIQRLGERVALLLFVFSNASAWSVKLLIPPPNQLLIKNLWAIRIRNESDRDVCVKLRIEVKEQKQGLVFKAMSNSFTVSAHLTKKITAEDIKEENVWWKPGYEQQVKRTGKFPPGTFVICVFLLRCDGKELARDCITHQVFWIRGPNLISPKDKSLVSESNPLFSWTDISPPITGRTFKIRICQILEGQSPQEAMESNIAWFEKGGITATSLQYPTSARAFEKGKEYAWQIITMDKMEALIGRSEIQRFSFGKFRGLISREEAIRITIEQIIKPASLDHVLVAWLGYHPLKKGATVRPYFEKGEHTITKPTWFVWIDDMPDAFFAHPTRFVYIDATTGLFEIEDQEWWPVVNGKSLWMSDEEQEDPNLIIYSTYHR